MTNWLSTAATAVQVVGVIWALLFGSKVVVDVISDLRNKVQVKIDPLITLNILVAILIVLLLGITIHLILIPLSMASSSVVTAKSSRPTPMSPVVTDTLQTKVLCSPTRYDTGSSSNSSFGGDGSDHCGGHFDYTSLPTPTLAVYALQVDPPDGTLLDHCNIFAYIPSLYASAQHARYDLWVAGHWLGWTGYTVNQAMAKGWQDLQLGGYTIQGTGSLTLEVQVQDQNQVDQSGEIAWSAMKFECLFKPT